MAHYNTEIVIMTVKLIMFTNLFYDSCPLYFAKAAL